MKILLVRHGETDFNKNKLIQGHSDIVLNETGKEQAINAGQKITNFNIDAVFSSPLKRALETARLMLDNSNNSQNERLDLVTDSRLIEKYFGDFEGSTFDEYFKALDTGSNLETIEQEENVYKRAHSFFLDKYEDYNNKTILVVCHGALIRIFLRELGLYPETRELIKNTALNILRFDGNNFILEKFNI